MTLSKYYIPDLREVSGLYTALITIASHFEDGKVTMIGIRTLTRSERKRLLTSLLFISPWIVGFLAFRVYPFFASLYYSFTFYPILDRPKWVGLANYADLFEDPRFLTSLYNTSYYALGAVPLATIVGILLAMLLNARVRALSFFSHHLFFTQHHPSGGLGAGLVVDVRPD
jgi:ABC-type polysaccharide transport system permease subunit